MSNAIADQMPNNGPDRYERMFKDMQRQIDQMRAAMTLDMASITPLAGHGIRTGDFDGTDFAHPGTVGNYFGGDGLVANNVYFRPGSVSTDALAHPVRGDVMTVNGANFALTTSMVTRASQTWTVPVGFNSVSVDVTAKIYAVNSTAGLDYVYARPRIVRVSDGATVLPSATPTAASGSGGSGTSSERYVAVIALALGDQVTISVEGQTAFAGWAANASNFAEVTGSLTWYRV